MTSNICLASCYLPLAQGPELWLPDFHAALRQHGLELLFAHPEPPGSNPWTQLQLPFWLREFACFAPAQASSPDGEEARCLAERARAWEGRPEAELGLYLRAYTGCRLFFHELIEQVRPACVLVWGSSFPSSVILRRVAEDYGVPVWVWERGLLPDTLMLDLRGHGAGSDLNLSFVAKSLQEETLSGNLYEEASAYYLSGRATKYAQADFLSKREFEHRYKVSGRKLVSFIGHTDQGSGLVPSHHGQALIHSPNFPTTPDAVRALAAAVQRRGDSVLLFKPHPLDHRDYRPYECDLVRVAPEANLHNLFEYSDVLVFQLSTAQFEAIFYKKPILLLARSQIAGWKAFYELVAGQDLSELLDQGLRAEDLEKHLRRQRAFVGAVLRHYLIGTNSEVPARHGLEDLASFLSSNCLSVTPNLSLAAAIQNFRERCIRLSTNLTEDVVGTPSTASLPLPPEDRDAVECVPTCPGAQCESSTGGALVCERAQARATEGDTAEALRNFQQAVRLAPHDPEPRMACGALYRALGRIDEACRQFQAATRLAPDSAPAHAEFAASLLALNRPDEAERAILWAQALPPHSWETRKLLAGALRALGRSGEAARIYAALARQFPADLEIALEYAECHLDQGHVVLAELLYETVLDQHPECAQAAERLTQARTSTDRPTAGLAAHRSPFPTRKRSARVYPLELHRMETREQFEEIWPRFAPVLERQNRLLPAANRPFKLPGFCVVCEQPSQFTTDFLFASPDADGHARPSWRERQICTCGLNCRQRSCFHLLAGHALLPRNARIYCTEQKTVLFQKVSEAFQHVVGSEFLQARLPLGGVSADGIRNEDLTRLTFDDEAFDGIFSLDVLEHVPDYHAALSEIVRCLKPGGLLLLTVPFHFDQSGTTVRATLDGDGRPRHLLPAVYHGDPINPKGCLCFNDFGWDLLNELKQAGLSDAALHVFTTHEYGYLGLQYAILGTKVSVAKHRDGHLHPGLTLRACNSPP